MVTFDGTQPECLQALEALHAAAMDYAMAAAWFNLDATHHDSLVTAERVLHNAAVHWESVSQSSQFNIIVTG